MIIWLQVHFIMSVTAVRHFFISFGKSCWNSVIASTLIFRFIFLVAIAVKGQQSALGSLISCMLLISNFIIIILTNLNPFSFSAGTA